MSRGSHTPLRLALSPYHLTTAEPAALAAVLIGSNVHTMMPAPFGFAGGERGREQVKAAVERSPGYLRLMEAWRWAAPLWEAGVIRSTFPDDSAAGDEGGGRSGDRQEVAEEVHRIWARLTLPSQENAEDPLTPLRAVMRPTLYRDEREYLDRLSADLLKGGPDPGISVCIAAALDALAVKHGMAAVRAGISGSPGSFSSSSCGAPAGAAGGSVWQRAEAALCRRTFAVAVPVLLRASGKRILQARERLRPQLDDLRTALAAAASGAADTADRLTEAAAAYTHAFRGAHAEVAEGDDDRGVRVQDGFVSLTGVLMPSDAALRSGLTAVKSLGARTGRPAPVRAAPTGPDDRLDGPAGAMLTALVVKRMNVRPEAEPAAEPLRSRAASAGPARRQ